MGEYGESMGQQDNRNEILGERNHGLIYEYGDALLGEYGDTLLGEYGDTLLGEHIGSPLRGIIQWYKTMMTNEYIRNVKHNGWRPFDGKLFQRNYYERVVRGDRELNRIRNYIVQNPVKRSKDQNYG